jgi:hypothetical protein
LPALFKASSALSSPLIKLAQAAQSKALLSIKNLKALASSQIAFTKAANSKCFPSIRYLKAFLSSRMASKVAMLILGNHYQLTS